MVILSPQIGLRAQKVSSLFSVTLSTCLNVPWLYSWTLVWFDWLALRVLWQGIAKYADFKIYEDEGLNTTDVDASLQQLKDNDAKLKELNLNNIKVVTWDGLLESFALNACIACVIANTRVEKVLHCFANDVFHCTLNFNSRSPGSACCFCLTVWITLMWRFELSNSVCVH